MTGLTVPTVPPTIQLRPSRLVAVLLAAVVLTASLTWFLVDLTLDTGSQTRGAAPLVATPQDLQAAHAGVYAGRTVPVSADRALAAATLAAGVAPGAAFTSADRALAAATLAAGVAPGAAFTSADRALAAATLAAGVAPGVMAVTLTPEVVAPAYSAGPDDVARRSYAAALATLTPEIVAPAYSAAVYDVDGLAG